MRIMPTPANSSAIPLPGPCSAPKIPLPCGASDDAQAYDMHAIVAESRDHSACPFRVFPASREIPGRGELRFQIGDDRGYTSCTRLGAREQVMANADTERL